MTTIINTPGNGTSNEGGSGGWAVAVIILIIVIAVGAYFWVRYHRAAAPSNGGATINLTLPAQNSGGNTSGNSGY